LSFTYKLHRQFKKHLYVLAADNKKSNMGDKVKSYLIMFGVVVAGTITASYLVQYWNKPKVQAPKTTTA
jgi:hypothetical protein